MIYIIPTDTCFGLACSIDDANWFKMIYDIKWREFNKPLAIMVNDFLIFENILNTKQIEFLRNYHRPWTLLIDSNLHTLPSNYKQNTSEYIALRVANNDIEKELISETWPIFLTSANLAWEKETYKISWLNKLFWKYKDVKVLAKKDLQEVSPSDIFEFIWETTNVKYLRKN